MSHETIKILEENIGSKISNLSYSNIFAGMFLQARETKAKINKWDYIKLKSFCTATETIDKTKENTLNRKTYLPVTYLIRG